MVSHATPPPLPSTQPTLLDESDFIDEREPARVPRAKLPTLRDEPVELTCFSRSEPPPRQTPSRRVATVLVALLALAAAGALLFGPPLATRLSNLLHERHPQPMLASATLSPAALASTTPASVTVRAAGPVARASTQPGGREASSASSAGKGSHAKPAAHGKRPAQAPHKAKQQPKHGPRQQALADGPALL